MKCKIISLPIYAPETDYNKNAVTFFLEPSIYRWVSFWVQRRLSSSADEVVKFYREHLFPKGSSQILKHSIFSFPLSRYNSLLVVHSVTLYSMLYLYHVTHFSLCLSLSFRIENHSFLNMTFFYLRYKGLQYAHRSASHWPCYARSRYSFKAKQSIDY